MYPCHEFIAEGPKLFTRDVIWNVFRALPDPSVFAYGGNSWGGGMHELQFWNLGEKEGKLRDIASQQNLFYG